MSHSDIQNAFIRRQHFIERYKSSQVANMRRIIRGVEPRIRNELLKTQTIRSRKVLLAKLNKIQELMEVVLTDFASSFQKDLLLFAADEAEFTAKTLEKFANDFDAVIPALSRLSAASNLRPFNNRFLRDTIKQFVKTQSIAIRNAVSMGFFESKTTPQIVSDILGTSSLNNTDGLLHVTRTSAERMARTAITHIASVSKDLLYQENDINYYEWISTLDGRTSTICMGLSGSIYKVGKGKLPPAHPNCRSTTAAILNDNIKIVNGKPQKLEKSDIPNYGDWLRKQPVSFQNEALGTSRAKLFRDGGLKVDRFTDRKDQPLTLSELKQKNPKAWERAGLGVPPDG